MFSYGENAEVNYTYDNLNRVSTETSVGVTHTYKYDLNGNRTNAAYGVTGRSVDWAYDALNRIETIVEGSNETEYLYDLNSKPVYRKYPSDVEEFRSFDAMGRLLTMDTYLTNGATFGMAYTYDLVGSALQMVQTSSNLTGKAQDAVTTWEYDDRYRLTAETVDDASSFVRRTEYEWDSADNRLFKDSFGITGTTTSSVSSIVYTNNALNQMVGYVAEAPGLATTNVAFFYDANGSRTNKSVTVGGMTSSSSYTYDEDNRLVAVAGGGDPGSLTHAFKYDYRSRRYYRSTPSTPHMYCIFDGGLSIQEHEVNVEATPPSLSSLTTEFIRGEGMGGGVGGMVYSIKDDGSGNDDIICSHANHRGDIIARSNLEGSLTSFALYEAYGTRPYEWGTDPDRQKANTKEEETDLNLLNEGFRYRDLETGTFLTRDPIGYLDGPNAYCYVHCNPIMRFDAWGLDDGEETAGEQAAREAEEKAQAELEQAEEDLEAAQIQEEKDFQAYKDLSKRADEAFADKEARDRADKAGEKWSKSSEVLSQSAATHKATQQKHRQKSHEYNQTQTFKPHGQEKGADEKFREAMVAVNVADAAPIATVPVIGQIAGAALDGMAFAGNTAIYVDELVKGEMNLGQFIAVEGLNYANLVIGQVGNATSFVGDGLSSMAEVGLSGVAEGIRSGGENYNPYSSSEDD